MEYLLNLIFVLKNNRTILKQMKKGDGKGTITD